MATQLPDRSITSKSGSRSLVATRRGAAFRDAREQPVVQPPLTEASPPAAARHNWPLYGFLFFLPLQNLQTGYMPNLGGGLNFLNIGFALALIGAWQCHGRITHWSSVHRWVLLYILWSIVTLGIGYLLYPDSELKRFNDFKDSMLGLLIVFLVQMSVTDWSTLKRVFLFLLLPLPYILRVTWSEHAGISGWHYNDDMRIHGTFSLLGANEFASFCVTMALMLFALLLAAKLSKPWRVLLVGGIICMVMGVLWTYSRTAYVSILGGALVILLIWRGRWKLAIPLALAIMIVPPLLPTSVTERFDSTHVEGTDVDQSTEMRYVFWEVAWGVFKQYPITGVGNYTFSYVNPYKMDTHNLYMRTLAEKGTVGIVVLIGLLLSILRASWRTMRDSPSGSLGYALGLGMTSATLALMVGNFWGDRFTYAPMIGYFWVFVALTLKAREFVLAERAAATVAPAGASPQAAGDTPRFARPHRTRLA